MNCNQVTKKLLYYLLAELNSTEYDAISKHLASCSNCLKVLNQHKTFLAILSELKTEKISCNVDLFLAEFNQRVNRCINRTQRKLRLFRILIPTFSLAAVILLVGIFMKNIPKSNDYETIIDEATITSLASEFSNDLIWADIKNKINEAQPHIDEILAMIDNEVFESVDVLLTGLTPEAKKRFINMCLTKYKISPNKEFLKSKKGG
ncbi:MAG: zf-HC2 domain-containing protein [candidate division WOR-3 bacterium]|nr:zf-HC2 domain-containing protein [candidate division WOR-3 bacterium]MCX7757292.1 zf-HC2 domain-containing protein [candidate division WOR-3 bacterium]MDW7988030.1 hypothetical protein [candidate division WOR-3 bacterium]